MNFYRTLTYIAALGVALNLTGCPSSSSSSAPGPVNITGTVSAPGSTTGTIAFAQPNKSFKSMFANLFTTEAQATSVVGTAPVGAGVTVELFEIDNTGAKVGNTLATTTTAADGSYTLVAASTFVASSKYVVHAKGATEYLDSIVTGTTVNVDPGSDVTKSLVISAASGVAALTTITPQTVAEIQNTVEQLANDVPAFSDITTARSMLLAKGAANEEASNMISSLVSGGVISGTVKDGNNAALPNIKIVVRDYNNWVTRAVTRTDSTGAYTVKVPAGDYILGAINMTTNTAASEWWKAGTGANVGATNQFSADKITVGTTTPVTGDFILDPGVAISGTITGASSAPVRGILVQLRDFTNDQPVTGAYTGIDGTYRLNVRAGSYTLGAYNTTVQPYASQIYNSVLTNGGTNATEAEKVVLAITTPATPKIANFSLIAGREISGIVTDGATTPNNIPGMAVRFYASTGAFVNGVRTNNVGYYHLWLVPNTSTADKYIVRSRGQTHNTDLSTASQTTGQDFTAQVGQITATIMNASNPVGQVKVGVYSFPYSSTAYQGFETSNGDGTVTLYTTLTSAVVEFKVDNGSSIASQIYNSTALTTNFGGASLITVAVNFTTVLGTISLSDGGVLSGIVTDGNSLPTVVPLANYIVQIRSGGTNVAAQFTNTRTQLDGSYSISLPAGAYKIRTCEPIAGCSGTSGFSDITIGAGSNTQDLVF